MGPTLVALIWLPCVSVLHQSALGNETVAMACPDTVKYVYDVAQPQKAAPKVEKTKPVAVKEKTASKKKRRKRRRRK